MGLGRHQRRADHHRWPSSGTTQGRDYPRKRKPSASGSERRRRIRGPGEIRFSGVQAMSASGPKRTSLAALHMSAIGGKADMTDLMMGPGFNSISKPAAWILNPGISRGPGPTSN